MISHSGPLSIDGFRTMLGRMVKSARLNRDTFLELKEDTTATGQALIVLALAGASFGVGFAAVPRVANPRRCTRDRRSLDSDFDSDRGEDRYGTRYSAQPCDIHRSHIHRSLQLWIRGLSIESDPDSHYPQHEATLTVQQSDSLERWACIC